MTREEAIRILDPKTTGEALAEIEYYHGFSGHVAQVEAVNEACKIAVASMRRLTELESHSKALENEPLTIEELLKMDETPVYVVDTVNGSDSQWCVVSVSEHFPGDGAAYPAGTECFWFDFEDYGTEWLAYLRKPETAEKP